MKAFENYVLGQWVAGEGAEWTASDARTGAPLGTVSSAGLNFDEVLAYGRAKGGTALRKMTFPERGRMLKALALYLTDRKESYYALSAATGATRVDSWIDIEGGIGNLFANASLRKEFPDLPYFVDGDPVRLSKNGTFVGHHLMVPRREIGRAHV
jgi:oxepin-CoA hydrolase/3-oxo-5,6-dehydrosuberyl-CoA semialdehyde dehydrogenase